MGRVAVDIDREMERLAKEAKQRVDAERGPEEAAPRGAARDLDAEALADAKKLARRPEGAVSLGQKMAIVLVGLVAIWGVWTFVLGPLLSIALTLAVLGLVVFGIVKLMDAVADEDDEDGAPRA